MAAPSPAACLAVHLAIASLLFASTVGSPAAGAAAVANSSRGASSSRTQHAPVSGSARATRKPGAPAQSPPTAQRPRRDPRLVAAEEFEAVGDGVYEQARNSPDTRPFLESAQGKYQAGLDTLFTLAQAHPEDWHVRLCRGNLMWKLERITNTQMAYNTVTGPTMWTEFTAAPLEELTQAVDLSHGDREAYLARGEFLFSAAADRMYLYDKTYGHQSGVAPDSSLLLLVVRASADLATTLALGSPSCVPYERLARLNNFGHRFAAAARFYARARDCGYTIETKNLRYFEEHAREVPPAWSVFDIPDSPDPEQMRAWRAAH